MNTRQALAKAIQEAVGPDWAVDVVLLGDSDEHGIRVRPTRYAVISLSEERLNQSVGSPSALWENVMAEMKGAQAAIIDGLTVR